MCKVKQLKGKDLKAGAFRVSQAIWSLTLSANSYRKRRGAFGFIDLSSSPVPRLERAVHPPVPRRRVLARKVNPAFRALGDRKQGCHLSRFKISVRTSRPGVLVPYLTRAAIVLTI